VAWSQVGVVAVRHGPSRRRLSRPAFRSSDCGKFGYQRRPATRGCGLDDPEVPPGRQLVERAGGSGHRPRGQRMGSRLAFVGPDKPRPGRPRIYVVRLTAHEDARTSRSPAEPSPLGANLHPGARAHFRRWVGHRTAPPWVFAVIRMKASPRYMGYSPMVRRRRPPKTALRPSQGWSPDLPEELANRYPLNTPPCRRVFRSRTLLQTRVRTDSDKGVPARQRPGTAHGNPIWFAGPGSQWPSAADATSRQLYRSNLESRPNRMQPARQNACHSDG